MNRQVSTVSVVLLVWALLGAATCQANEEDEAGSLVKVFVRRGPVLIGELKEETPDSLKLLNLTTGEELTIARASVAALRRNVSHEEAIKRVGLVPYLAWRVKRAKGLALRGEVVEVTRTSVYVNLGERHGVQLAAQLNVYRDGEEVKDPQTGEVLGKLCALVGKAEVIGVAQKSSEVKLRGDGPAELQPGDVVELAGRGTTVAILPIIAAEEAARQSAERIRADWTRALVARGVWVLEPADVDRAINELGLAKDEYAQPQAAIRVGKALGACAVVTGSVRPGPRGHPAMLYPHLIVVSTGRRLSARPQPVPEAVPVERAAEPPQMAPAFTLRQRASRAARLLVLAERCRPLARTPEYLAKLEFGDYGANCYALIPIGMPWHQAKAACEQLGGHLAIITSNGENRFIWDELMVNRTSQAWIGLSDEAKEGDWRWVDGRPVTFCPWGPGQPNNPPGENHAIIGHPGPLWGDTMDKGYSFICEWEGAAFDWQRPDPSPPYGFGAMGQPVTPVDVHQAGVMVWPVMPEFCGAGRYRVSVKQATTGLQGAFYITAWADTDGDTMPDKEMGRSEKKVASEAGVWPSWEFRSEGGPIFVGVCWDQGPMGFYAKGPPQPEGWFGLGNMRYQSEFGGVPRQPRPASYTNIRVVWTPE